MGTSSSNVTINVTAENDGVTLTVGPNSTYPTIAAAMAAASSGDIISLEAGSFRNAKQVCLAAPFSDGTGRTQRSISPGFQECSP